MAQEDQLKAMFWNIGKQLTEKKLELLKEAMSSIKPDIFCIAEGSYSKNDCQLLVKTFSDNGYKTYYSPLFPEPKEMGESDDAELGYVDKRYRLKIFHKETITLETPFTFTALRENGRIIVLKIFYKYKPVTFIFVHNKSKEGETEDTLYQTDHIKGIYELIQVGKTVKEKERLIIMGDFNLNPWDRLLLHKTHLNTSFFQNRNSILQRHPEKCFYNPIVDSLSKSRTVNLGGTHLSQGKKWGVFDFVLYDTKDIELDFDIVTEFDGGSKLLNSSTKIKKDFFNHHLDHLPILATITKFNL